MNSLNELMELAELYHRWIVRGLLFIVLICGSLIAYQVGYGRGFGEAQTLAEHWVQQNCRDTEPSSHSSLHDGQPGRMWNSEVSL